MNPVPESHYDGKRIPWVLVDAEVVGVGTLGMTCKLRLESQRNGQYNGSATTGVDGV